MPIELSTTRTEGEQHGIKVLVYGLPGSGKTRLCATAPKPLIISNEGGLLSLREQNIPVIKVKNLEDMEEALYFVQSSQDAKDFETICLDSVSEMAEVVLSLEKASSKDPRAAYGETQDRVTSICRKFRDLRGRHIYFSAKQERKQNEQSVFVNAPSFPGTKLGLQIPYMFDEVFCLRVESTEEGDNSRVLQTDSDFRYVAKDRSGALDLLEAPNLSLIFDKITRGNSNA